MTNATLWAADPHRYGPGKTHLVDPDKPERTYCGIVMAAFPGKPLLNGQPNCRKCCDAPIKRQEQAARTAAWTQEYEDRKKLEEAEWRRQYNEYLESEAWQEIRAIVLQRANWVCEGCARAKAIQVHHLTYQHLGYEFLWELKAVCLACHERAHPKEESL